MAPQRQHSPCVLDWPPVGLSGNVNPNHLSMFSLVVLSSKLLTLRLLCSSDFQFLHVYLEKKLSSEMHDVKT